MGTNHAEWAVIPRFQRQAWVVALNTNLLEFATGQLAQTGAIAPEIAWRKIRQSAVGTSLLDHAPNDLWVESTGAIRAAFLMGRNTTSSVIPALFNRTRTARGGAVTSYRSALPDSML